MPTIAALSVDFSAEHAKTINHENQSPPAGAGEMARQLGLGMRWWWRQKPYRSIRRLPLLAEFTGGQIAVINRMDNEQRQPAV